MTVRIAMSADGSKLVEGRTAHANSRQRHRQEVLTSCLPHPARLTGCGWFSAALTVVGKSLPLRSRWHRAFGLWPVRPSLKGWAENQEDPKSS